jgi:succinate dehydrogenase flavin-adding protein (antitoxin of CptAB toxin-antitoxin module)
MKEENTYPLSHANIIEILGVQKLPIEKRTALVDAVIDLVDARVRNRVLEALSEKEREHFISLLEGGDEDVIADFLEDNNLDLLKFSEEEVQKAKEELVDFTQKVEEEI